MRRLLHGPKDGPSGQTYFTHVDWLGTERGRTDKNGAVTETCTNLPFGDWQSCTGTNVSPIHFTGKERDSETDNDYFGGRVADLPALQFYPAVNATPGE